MSTKLSSRFGFLAALNVVLVAGGGSALAQGVGNLGQLPVAIQPSGNGWVITDPNGLPLPVVRDPLGPVWHKDLFGDAAGVLGGVTYTLQEQLVVAGNLTWSDWHEDILTPGWTWSNPILLVNGNIPAGYSVVNTGASVSFYFNPIAPGSIVDIRKDLVYTGPVPAVFPSISVDQYPTPEPASALLLGAGGLLLRRRRKAFHG